MNNYPSIPCFKAYDVRGKVPQDLNPDLATRIGRAFVELLSARRVVVGYDVRFSSLELYEALTQGLTQAGADVQCIGQCGTEMMYFAVSHLHADGGIMITASHNPPEYNGMKLVRDHSKPISQDSGLKEIERLAAQGSFRPSSRTGAVQSVDVMEEYIQHLLTYIRPQDLAPLKVVVNAGNGCAGPVVDRLESHLPIEIVKIHHEPDGAFPHGVPNPMIIENRTPTIQAVLEHGAALGVAWDGDFDRCFLFDERGHYIEGYYIVGFLAGVLLEKHRGGKIVYDPRLTWNTIEIVEQLGGRPIQCKSGHSFIKEMMRREDAIYGGEMSCHHYFRDFFFCDSGMIPWLLVLEILSETRRPMSELVEECILRYPVSGEINRTVADQDQVIETIRNHFAGEHPRIDQTDGLSYEFSDWRFNLRKSNTEPILRLNIESRNDMALLEIKTNEILGLIQS